MSAPTPLPRPPRVLSIAGSDPSGGAGIQADLKAIAANDGYGMAAITALTVQNTQGVRDVHLVPPAFVAEQIRAVFDDVQVDAVKIGMIATAAIAASIADVLAACAPCPIVLDPVMVAKSGHRLLDEDAVQTVRTRLLPLATVITPNLPEAAVLANRAEPSTDGEMPELAAALQGLGAKAVLLKGGHLTGPSSPDLLRLSDGSTLTLPAERLATRNTHGTGCTLSATLATWLGHGYTLEGAAKAAKAYLSAALASADRLQVGKGQGPVDHFHASAAVRA